MHRTFRVLEMSFLLLIVLVVAALVLPACQRSDSVPVRSSLNNMKHLAVGVLTYAQDNDGAFPGWVRNPDGRYAHNVWDEQIALSVKSNRVYNNKDMGFRSLSDPARQRVITYGLNGFLICSPKNFDGTAYGQLTANEQANNAPIPLSVRMVGNPADTILFAEVATEQPVSAEFQSANWPVLKDAVARGGDQWTAAMIHWIDISPREWVENSPNPADSYEPNKWNATSGVARDFYGGGGNYAFVDGHVQFHKIGQTVGLGKTVTTEAGNTYTVAAGNGTIWRADNPYNLWNPRSENVNPDDSRAGGLPR